MISITLHNFKDKESLTVYELPEGSSVIDLKAEIEATEGIPIGHQRLNYGRWDKTDLQDDESLEVLISRGPLKSIFHLVEARIYCQPSFKERDVTESDKTSYQGKKEFFVDLDEPIRTSSLTHWMCQWFPSTPELSVLDSITRRIVNISDINQSFSYYGICNNDVINIVSEPWTSAQWEYYRLQERLNMDWPLGAPRYHKRYAIVKAKYNWDGEILKHPKIKGLPLERSALFDAVTVMPDNPNFKETITSPGWLYGTSISFSELNSQLSFLNLSRLRKRPYGYFPENFVSPVEEEVAEQQSEAPDVLEIPPLPPFHFPPATGMTFRVPISDKGHSFLKLTVNYECISSPVDSTHVTASLLCSTHDIRRVSAVSVFIMVPEGEVSDIQVCENEAHRKEIHTEKEVTENRSKEKHLEGVNFGTAGTTIELQGGISGKHSFGSTEKGSKVSRRKVTATIDRGSTIFWNLKAPTSKLDEDGLDGEESITFILKKKPVLFKYKCRVTHAKNGVEKSIERRTKSWPLNLF